MIEGPLSQEEIDAILRSHASHKAGDPEAGPDDAGADEEPAGAVPEGALGDGPDEEVWGEAAPQGEPGTAGDDPRPAPGIPLSEEDMDVLAEVANIAMGSAATAVSALVQRKVVITAPTVSVSTPQEVWDQFELPTVTVEVRFVEGLKGKNLFILRPRDAAVIADLMMGNDGRNPPEELDDLHLSAVSEAMNQMMGASATAMSDFFKLRVDITPPEAHLTEAGDRSPLASTEQMMAVAFRLRIEDLIDSNFVQLMPFPFARDLVRMARQAVMGGAVEGGAAWDEEPEGIEGSAPQAGAAPGGVPQTGVPETGVPQTGVPHAGAPAAAAPASEPAPVAAAAEPAVQRAVFPKFQEQAEEAPPLHNVSLELIRHIPVEISATLGETEMTLKDLLRLTTGALVQLNTEENDLVRIFANGVEIARGEVVVVGEHYGVRITDIVGPAQRLNSLQR